MSPREHALLVLLYRKMRMVGVHTFIAHSGDNWKTLTNVMEKKGTMAAHTLELPSPDVRRWNLKQTILVF